MSLGINNRGGDKNQHKRGSQGTKNSGRIIYVDNGFKRLLQ